VLAKACMEYHGCMDYHGCMKYHDLLG
jgi:hypothetical protein